MKITICGSMYHIGAMQQAQALLQGLGYEVIVPNLTEGTGFARLPDEEKFKVKDGLIREHLGKINSSDAILVYNAEKKGVAGYIGGNTLMEMAFAYTQGIEIFLLNPARHLSYADEVYGMQPIMLNGEVAKIDEYFNGLPTTYVSSKSPIKLRAVSRGMRRAGIRTNVLPHPTNSNVTEQPQTIEETYEGALNRHDGLKRETAGKPPVYLATLESGLAAMHPDHNVFNTTVAVLEKVGGERKVGIDVNLEYPKAMTDKVPSQYPDLGILVQEEYGSELKDPFPYFTGGKIDRLRLLENVAFGLAVQFTEIDNKAIKEQAER